MRSLLVLAIALTSLIFPAAAEKRVSVANSPNQLVTVIATVDHRVIRPGDDLRVTVTLAAGPKGTWIPNHFGDFNETCRSGFSADIFALNGKRASDAVKSCAGSWLIGSQPASELLNEYVFLKPGETRSWHTRITNITRSPGIYEIKAEYLSVENRIHEVALPEVHGLMAIGHIRASPVHVRIR